MPFLQTAGAIERYEPAVLAGYIDILCSAIHQAHHGRCHYRPLPLVSPARLTSTGIQRYNLSRVISDEKWAVCKRGAGSQAGPGHTGQRQGKTPPHGRRGDVHRVDMTPPGLREHQPSLGIDKGVTYQARSHHLLPLLTGAD